MTLLELAKQILRLTGSRSEIVFRPLPDRRPEGAPARHRRARACSAGSRAWTLEEGLRQTIEWFRADGTLP